MKGFTSDVWVRRGGRFAVSGGLLAVLWFVVDGGEVLERLAGMELPWVALAILVSAVQVGLLAWQWRFTALRLGLRLSYGRALREYYLAVFMNQVLPGGMLGDLSRAWRHGRREEAGGKALHAVVMERGSGQVVMAGVALVSLAVLLPSPGEVFRGLLPAFGAAVVVVALGLGVTARSARLRRRLAGPVARSWADVRAAFLSPRALPVQLACSSLAVASYLAVFLLSARALSVPASASALLPLAAPVLLAMLIPLSVAGWGVREGVAALLWTLVGLDAVEGVAISVSYGLLIFMGSLPGGVLLLLAIVHSGPGRRGGRVPEGSGGRTGEEPHSERRWGPA